MAIFMLFLTGAEEQSSFRIELTSRLRFFRRVQNQVVVGRNQGNKGDFLAFDDLQNLIGPEGPGRVNINRGADIGEGEGEKSGVDVAQGHDVHAHVVLGRTRNPRR